MAEERKKTTMADLLRWQAEHVAAEVEKRRQQYEKEYASGEQLLPWGLKDFLDSLAGLAHGEALNELAKRRGDMRAVYERAPGAIPALVEHIARVLKLSPPAVAAALGLPSSPHDALDTLLLDTLRALAPEARNGLLPLSLVVAEVNAGCGEGLTPRFIASRLRALGCVLTAHHPAFVVVIPRLLPSEADPASTLLLPSPEESRENGSHTVTSAAHVSA